MPKQFWLETLILLLLTLTLPAWSQPYTWQNFTCKKEITSLETAAGYVWATSNGGVVRVDLQTGSVRSYINSDGLGSIATTFSAYAEPGQVYFGSSDGYLSVLDLATQSFSLNELTERDGQALKLAAADSSGGFLWIATDIGVVKFDRFRHGG